MTQTTMKAVRLHEFGGPHRLRHDDVPRPTLGAGEVLVRVHAASLNPPDWYTREGMPGVPAELKPKFDLPLILGTDVSGVIEAAAGDVDGFAVGDEVVAMARFPDPMQSGAYAEFIAVPAADVGRKPQGLSHVEAAGLPMSGLTAWQFLIEVGHEHRSPFQEATHVPLPLGSQSTVLVNGAAGGVGHLAVQLAKWKGARVIAVASGRHEKFLRSLNVDEFIDYTQQDAAEMVRGVDVVLDTVGGPASRRFLATLKRGGHLYPIYFGEFDEEENARLGVTVTAVQVRASGSQLDELAQLVDSGALRVAVDSVYPLFDASAAHARADGGHLQGKVVLEMGLRDDGEAPAEIGTTWPANRTETQGTRSWFEMVGTLMVEAAGRLDLPDRVTFVERYEDGEPLGDGVVQGIRFDVADGKATFRVGVRQGEAADIEVTVTKSAARALNSVWSSDPAYGSMRHRYSETGELRVAGDPAPLAELMDLLHDPIVQRTR